MIWPIFYLFACCALVLFGASWLLLGFDSVTALTVGVVVAIVWLVCKYESRSDE